MQKVHFITYANHVFQNAKDRLCEEAQKTGWFNSIKDFTIKYKDILGQNRGGYWIWKY